MLWLVRNQLYDTLLILCEMQWKECKFNVVTNDRENDNNIDSAPVIKCLACTAVLYFICSRGMVL